MTKPGQLVGGGVRTAGVGRRHWELSPRAQARHDERVPITEADFVDRLVEAVPETQALVEEHRCYYGGDLLLPHLMADLRRFIIGVFQQGDDRPLVQRCLALIDLARREGDARVENAVSVSFIEGTPVWDQAMQPFIDLWPEALRAEAIRQRDRKPSSP